MVTNAPIVATSMIAILKLLLILTQNGLLTSKHGVSNTNPVFPQMYVSNTVFHNRPYLLIGSSRSRYIYTVINMYDAGL